MGSIRLYEEAMAVPCQMQEDTRKSLANRFWTRERMGQDCERWNVHILRRVYAVGAQNRRLIERHKVIADFMPSRIVKSLTSIHSLSTFT
jgi:hypothetical protein